MFKETGELLAGFVAHGILIGLPGVAAVLLVMRRGLKSVPLLIAIGLVASGGISYVAFWAYYADPGVGITWDFLIFGGSLMAIFFCWREGGLDRELLRRLRTPLLLWIFGSAFIVFFGFLHGGAGNAVTTGGFRFGELPSDNDIPRFFAEWFAAKGHQAPPRYPGGWLASDRPPLQIGYVLAQHAFFNTAQGLHYQILCVIENALWIPAMWALLVAVRLRPMTRAVAMLAAMLSDIAILHGFFVWPKLIAAAFLLAALAVVLSPEWREASRRDVRIALLIGALLALSLLSHGSSLFGVIPLAVFATFRGVPSWRWIAAAAASLLLFYVPWTAYQHWGDPPGNRLLKWQLGGDLEVDSKGTFEAIEDGYQEVGLGGAINLKEDNFEEMVGWPRTKDEFNSAVDALDEGKLGIALEKVRWDRFFCLFPFLGILLFGPIAMIVAWLVKKRRDPDEWRFALLCFAFFVIACVIWGLMLFGTPDTRTTIHVGSLAVPLLGVVGCIVGMRSVYPRAGTVLAIVNAISVVLLFAPSLTPPEAGTTYSVLNGLFTLLSLAGIAWVLFNGLIGPSTWRSLNLLRMSATPELPSRRAEIPGAGAG